MPLIRLCQDQLENLRSAISGLLLRIRVNSNLILLLVFLLLLIISLIVYPGVFFEGSPSIYFEYEIPLAISSESVTVDISGAIEKPGVYKVLSGERLDDLITHAGGFLSEYDKFYVNSEINLAQVLVDGDKYFIPFRNEKESESLINELISINEASLNELMQLPGVGESTASKIISNRPYLSIDELLDVPGIGTSKFEQIRSLVRL